MYDKTIWYKVVTLLTKQFKNYKLHEVIHHPEFLDSSFSLISHPKGVKKKLKYILKRIVYLGYRNA